MRNILLLSALLLLVNTSWAQNHEMQVWYSKGDTSVFAKGDTVSPGDSTWVYVKYNYVNQNDTAWLYINDISNTYNWLVWHDSYGNLDKIKKVHTPNMPANDSCTIIKFKVHELCIPGPAQYRAKNKFPVYVKAKPTGIDEYHPVGSVIRSEYYDFLGRKITPEDQTIVIRVDHYSNGYTAARKYFYIHGR